MSSLLITLFLSTSTYNISSDFQIDHNYEGGNVIVDKIEGDQIHIRPDLRDTKGSWFYWNFRVKNAAGKTLKFNFPRRGFMSIRGVAVSNDQGNIWKWAPRDTDQSFHYSFKKNENEVQFCISIPYTQRDLSRFLKKYENNKKLQVNTLCQSKKGRRVVKLHLGKLGGEPEFRVLITARHHACEMIASYTLEGIMNTILSESKEGEWYRQHVEFLIIPIVDHDGVLDGDQGKNRKPRDHNRDYIGESIHPEVAAIRKLVPEWSQGKLKFFLDMHCPGLSGKGSNEKIYLLENDTPIRNNILPFCRLLEQTQTEGLPYLAKDTVQWGTKWNNAQNYSAGLNSSRWAGRQPDIRFASTIEIPYAAAKGVPMTRARARHLGTNIAKNIKTFLQQY